MKRAELVRDMREARAELELVLSRLSAEQVVEPGVAGEWSVKDMLAHLAWYEAEEAQFYAESGVQGSPLWQVPQDQRNELLFELSRDRPIDDVLVEFRVAHERFVSVVQGLSEADLAAPGRFAGTDEEWPPWRKIAVHSSEHDREHTAMIRAWLTRSYGVSA